MTTEREKLIKDIEEMEDEDMLEKVRIFILGILAQQSIAEKQSGAGEEVAG